MIGAEEIQQTLIKTVLKKIGIYRHKSAAGSTIIAACKISAEFGSKLAL